MIGAGHEERGAGSDCAVLADDQPFRTVSVEHVAVLEAGRVVGIVKVGVVADDDLGQVTSGLRNTTRWCAGSG
jgi:hypothetical protein